VKWDMEQPGNIELEKKRCSCIDWSSSRVKSLGLFRKGSVRYLLTTTPRVLI